jgi:sugar/nucleoside kinase (ribokinase family)
LEPLKKTTPEIFLGAVSGATMLFANEEESLALTGSKDVEGALRFLRGRFFEIVITLGANGALCQIGDEQFRVPSNAGLVLDTTGAGDAATGTYLGERLRGENGEAALRAAMAAASVTVRSLGAAN